ncbi:MAG: hypothetical protein QOF11_17 [Chloroflexota bacterium]|jgi:hypothetical protein|nr:hypothetical protein [Chloroflexota bacterium]
MRAALRHRFVRRTAGRLLRPLGWVGVAALLALSVLGPASVGAASPPVPSSGTATVDGSAGDWNLGADHFADMSDAGDPTKPVDAKLYLRYDCATETLYALVEGIDGTQFRQTRPENAYIRIDGAGKLVSGESGNDGTAPDFSWVNPDGELADGFEASGHVDPGSHTVRAHVLRPDDSKDGYQNVDNIGRADPLELVCETATPTPTATPTGTPNEPTATPRKTPDGGVEGATHRPHATLPPTSTIDSTESSGPSLGLVFLGLGLVMAGALVLLEKPRIASGRRR